MGSVCENMMPHLISIKDLSKEQLLDIVERARAFKREGCDPTTLQGKVMASCFFEPSTRTRLSFEAAMLHLGGSVIGFSDAETTAIKKGESLSDCMKVVGSYADIVVIRHPQEGAARLAAENCGVPVINAGDGANEHPTQTLLDLMTIQECQGKLDGLNIVCAGDLRYGRTVHSLVYALQKFDVRFFFVSPPELGLPHDLTESLKSAGILFSSHQELDEVLGRADIVYMTRMQKERMSQDISKKVSLAKESLVHAKPNMRILHPLPRVDEIDVAVDDTEYAYYFCQAENGLYVRQALFAQLLGES